MSNLYSIPKMQEETTAFKLDASDENIKRNTMKVVWMFSGVTFVDINEKGILKVKGNFDEYEMGAILQQEIDKSVDIINPKAEQNHIPGLTTVYNYFNAPKTQETVVFEFRVLNERIIPEAMEIIWEFSGVTSVEVKKDFYLRVKGGEFNKLDMATKLKDVDKHVKIIWQGQDVEAEPKKQSDVGSSKMQTKQDIKPKKMYRDPYGVPEPQHEPFKKQQGINQANQPLIYDAARKQGFMDKPNANWLLQQQKEAAYGVHAHAHGPFNQQQGIKQANQLPIYDDAHVREFMDKQNANQQKGGYVAQNHGKKKQPDQVNQQKKEVGVFAKMFGLNNQQPQVKQEGGKREIPNAQRFDPRIQKGPDGKYHIRKEQYKNPYAGSSKEAETSLARTIGSKGSTTSFKTTEFGSSSTWNRSNLSRSSSATNLSQSTLPSSTAYSSQSILPPSSWDSSHSRSRSSENLSQSLSSSTWNPPQPTLSSTTMNPYQSLKSNRASGSKRDQSSTKTPRT